MRYSSQVVKHCKMSHLKHKKDDGPPPSPLCSLLTDTVLPRSTRAACSCAVRLLELSQFNPTRSGVRGPCDEKDTECLMPMRCRLAVHRTVTRTSVGGVAAALSAEAVPPPEAQPLAYQISRNHKEFHSLHVSPYLPATMHHPLLMSTRGKGGHPPNTPRVWSPSFPASSII